MASFLFGISTKELGKFCQPDGSGGKPPPVQRVWEPSRGQARRLKAVALFLTAAGFAMRCSHLGKTCQLSFSKCRNWLSAPMLCWRHSLCWQEGNSASFLLDWLSQVSCCVLRECHRMRGGPGRAAVGAVDACPTGSILRQWNSLHTYVL